MSAICGVAPVSASGSIRSAIRPRFSAYAPSATSNSGRRASDAMATSESDEHTKRAHAPIAAERAPDPAPGRAPRRAAVTLPDDPLWYKDTVTYEAHVKAFFDANDDGVGDFKGLRAKLDYLQDIGVTAIWLLPFYPSPLRDDGYDIADYRDINPSYGTMKDFRDFVREAHRRGLRVITELVVNHTSDQHPW